MNTKKFFKSIIAIFLVIILLATTAFLAIIVTEYRPDEITDLEAYGVSDKVITSDSAIDVLTWNIGYSSLGDTSDFFMDGGKSVKSSTKEAVASNLDAIADYISEKDPDIALLQEVDLNSSRSYGYNQFDFLKDRMNDYVSSFAYNFKCIFVPYPLPPIGRVASGISSFSRFDSATNSRLSLPNPFKWPIRVANLKRCLLESRYPIEGSDKELVVYNAHLEAYDNGEGKIAQTKLLADLIDSEYKKGNYVIVGGDFNQTFSNVNTSQYPQVDEEKWIPGIIDEKDFSDGFHLLMDSTNPTCRSLDRPYDKNDENFQYYVIDGFIISDNIELISLNTENLFFKNTDHNPVLMTISLKSEIE